MLQAQTRPLNVRELSLLIIVVAGPTNPKIERDFTYKSSNTFNLVISRAFQVLSDTDKRAAFDRHGGDPDSRAGGATDVPRGFGGGGGPFGFAPAGGGRGGPMFEGEISPEDLFNMFFGGMGPGATMFGEGAAGGFTTFGGPGIRIHQFGGQRRRRPAQAAAGGQGAQETQAQTSISRIFIQLLPLIIFFILPILGSLFTGDNTENLRGPSFKQERGGVFTQMRQTPNYKIPFWVNPIEVKDLKKGDFSKLDKKAETSIINTLHYNCAKERELQQQEANEAHGWFSVDQVRLNNARKMPLPSCQRLNEFGVRIRQY